MMTAAKLTCERYSVLKVMTTRCSMTASNSVATARSAVMSPR